MAKAHFVKKARKAISNAGIKKGDSYWWWKFRNSAKQVSKNPPRPSQLTGSDFMSRVLAVQETFEDCDDDKDEIRSCIDNAVSELEDLKRETEDKLSNMPEPLQGGPTGELLQSRVDELDTMINDIQALDVDDDTPGESLLEELTNISYNGE